MEFVSEGKVILECLHDSWKNGTLVGIHAPDALGNGTFVTVVENIVINASETIVCLKEYDNTGYILPKRKILLSEISKIWVFRSQMANPYFKDLTGDRFKQILE